jgi:hypothetical protein
VGSSSEADRKRALASLQGRDRIGKAAEAASVATGVGAGVAVSGSVASAFGASTLLGSSTLGSVLGGVFVAATPVGWALGSAVAGCALGYGISRLVRSGAKSDVTRDRLRRSIQEDIERERAAPSVQPDQLAAGIEELVSLLESAARINRISMTEGDQIVSLVRQNKLPLNHATRRVRAVIVSAHRAPSSAKNLTSTHAPTAAPTRR